MMMRSIIIWAGIISQAHCVGRGDIMKPDQFSKLALPSFDKSSCSPTIPDDFVGIKIEAPAKIKLERDSPIPFCGVYRLPATVTLDLSGSIIESIIVVVKDKKKHTPHSFNLKPDKDQIQEDPGGIEYPQIDEDVSINTSGFDKGYFNIDLLTFYPDMPVNETTYIVYATLGEYISNSVHIQITE